MSRIPLHWIAIFLIIVAFVAFWDKSPNDLLDIEPIAESSRFPQAYMTDIALREYNPTGTLSNTLATRSAEYFQINPQQMGPQDYTLLEQPRMIFSSESGVSPWYLTAEQGRINQNGEQVTLLDNVQAQQQSTTQGLIELLTSELHLHTVRQYAETDKAVKMRAQQGQLDTLGMKAFLSEDRIELLSQVRGIYEP